MPADERHDACPPSAAIAGTPFLSKNVRYDIVKDFEPIGLIYALRSCLMVNSTFADQSVEGPDRVCEGEIAKKTRAR